jgi:3-hydroxyisobutyrate dehydrogenase-like beta-hydroxyacid dehydrogenase
VRSISLIGLGNAGRPIGERLLKKGYSLKVYDINPQVVEALVELGAEMASSAREATTEVTLTVLPSSVEVRAAVFAEEGILAGMEPGFILLDLSGTDPDCARELEQKIQIKRGKFIGGTLHANGAPAITIPKGLLSILIGGEKEILEACIGILKDLAQKIICLPEPWMPKALKIAVMMLATANHIISAEVCACLIGQGINPHLFLQLLQTTGSHASSSRMEEFFKRNKSHGGALSNSYKDIRQALKVAADVHLPLPFSALANQIQEIGRSQGLTRINTPAAIGKVYEILTGIDLNQVTIEGERAFPEAGEPQIFYLGMDSDEK